MFGFRTPAKSKGTEANTEEERTQKEGQTSRARTSPTSSVRRSIGMWESGDQETLPRPSTSPKKTAPLEPQKPKPKAKLAHETKAGATKLPFETRSPPVQEKQKPKYNDRVAEARACLTKAKLNLNNSRNIKTEIKTEVMHAIERLYQLVKESESAKGPAKTNTIAQEREKTPEREPEKPKMDEKLQEVLLEHSKLIKENNERMDKLKETMERHQEQLQKQTYASVVAAPTRPVALEQTALHSVVVTSKDEMETGEQVLDRIRSTVNAKEGSIMVEKIRKAKDRKVIMGCRTEEEREKLTERLKINKDLCVENIKNKDPLVILRSVLKYNTDEEVISALRKQNRGIFADADDHPIEIKYKRQSKNLLAHDIVLRVSPTLWQRMVNASTVQIDLQRVRVADQSPLVQCSQCLGYGHGRRFCKEALPKCSHCGGPHVKADCPDHTIGEAPCCCNCKLAGADRTGHNAFSSECPVRRKWDALARSTIAYC